MHIYIDADACPVVDTVLQLAKKHSIGCTILCDTAHHIHRPGIDTITVAKGADSVDFKLVNLVHTGDIAVTQDYGLAAMCLAKGAYAIHQDGILYTAENIDSLLFSRFLSKKVRAAGGRTKGPSKRTAEQDQRFEIAFNQLLESVK